MILGAIGSVGMALDEITGRRSRQYEMGLSCIDTFGLFFLLMRGSCVHLGSPER